MFMTLPIDQEQRHGMLSLVQALIYYHDTHA